MLGHSNNTKYISERKDIGYAKKGLINLNDTSYLNAILQCLGNISEIANFFLNPSNQEKIENNMKNKQNQKYPLSYVIQRLFVNLYPETLNYIKEVYSTNNIFKILDVLNPNKYYMQFKRKNPNDLIKYILMRLHEELKENNSSIINNFYWLELNENNCEQCKMFYEMNAPIFQLDICKYLETNNDNDNDITIKNLIDFYLKEDAIKEKCKQCNKDLLDIKKDINKSPNVSIFLLFNKDPYGLANDFIRMKFTIEEKLNLEQKTYDIIGIVSLAMRERKYVSFSKSLIDDQWYLYNDQSVSRINFPFIKKSIEDYNFYFPCILFYQENKENAQQ